MSTEVIENETIHEEPQVETVPSLTSEQRAMLEIDEQLIELNPKVEEAQSTVDELEEEVKDARKELKKVLKEQTELCQELTKIKSGNFQPGLPFNNTPHPDVEAGKNRPHGTPLLDATAEAIKQQEDPGKKTKVHDLDITEKQADALVGQSVYMITDLEDRIRNANRGGYAWHDGVENVAKGKATGIENALEAWRKDNPIPVIEDGEPEVQAKEPEPVEDEEPATIPMDQTEIVWWCCECDHTWPVDGENDQCPDCENETGNEKIGYGCPDANELGKIVRGYETVAIVDEGKMSCSASLYKTTDNLWISDLTLEDKTSGYAFSASLNFQDPGNSSRDAALFNELIHCLEDCKEIGDSLKEEIGKYVELHLGKYVGSENTCVACGSEYAFDLDNENKPHCPFCGAAEHTKSD